MNLVGKVAVVTGSGRGIGKATAYALAKQGAEVVVSSRTQSDIDSVKKDIEALGRKSLALRADVSNESDVKMLFAETLREFRRIDILINNAGIGVFAPVVDLSAVDFDRMWAVNMRGIFLCAREALPHMSKQRSGDIINISSLAGRNSFVGGAGYCATKWALIGFARCLMLEVREQNVRVVTLCPGSVDTDFAHDTSRSHRSTENIPKAEDIARVIIDTLLMPRHVMVSEVDIRPTNPKK